MSTLAERAAAAEMEASLLRCENERLRFVATRLSDALRAMLAADKHRSEATTAMLDGLGQFTFPTIPNN